MSKCEKKTGIFIYLLEIVLVINTNNEQGYAGTSNNVSGGVMM